MDISFKIELIQAQPHQIQMITITNKQIHINWNHIEVFFFCLWLHDLWFSLESRCTINVVRGFVMQKTTTTTNTVRRKNKMSNQRIYWRNWQTLSIFLCSACTTWTIWNSMKNNFSLYVILSFVIHNKWFRKHHDLTMAQLTMC